MTTDRFQNKYRIPSARANWHDYNGGAYFVTICTAAREHYLGKIICGDAMMNETQCSDAINRVATNEPQLILSEIGKYVAKIIQNVTSYYPYAEIPLFVVMPNHVHIIVMIDENKTPNERGTNSPAHCRDAINRVSTGGVTGSKNPILLHCLGTVIRGIKARVTHYAHQNQIEFAWQSRFHDRIIRDQNEMNRIANYIENNVAQWYLDCFNNECNP